MTETTNANLTAAAASATNGNGSQSQGPVPLTADDMEEVLMELNRFEKSPTQNIPDLLERYLVYVAKTGSTSFPWPKLKALFRAKLENVIVDFSNVSPTENIPSVPNVDVFNFGAIRNKVFEQLDAFAGIPFTVQRLAELLTSPKRHYKRTDKFMRALEKNMLIVSTVEARANNNDNDSESRNNYLMNGDYLNGSLDNAKPEDSDVKELPKSTEGVQHPQRDQLVVDEVDADMIDAPPQATSSQPKVSELQAAASEIIDDEMVGQDEEGKEAESMPQSSVPMESTEDAATDANEASQEATKEAETIPDRSEEATKEVTRVPELPMVGTKPIQDPGPVTRQPSMFIDNLPDAAISPEEEAKVDTNSQDENVQVQPPVEEAVDEPEKAQEVVDEPKKEEKESEPVATEDASSTDSKVEEPAAKET